MFNVNGDLRVVEFCLQFKTFVRRGTFHHATIFCLLCAVINLLVLLLTEEKSCLEVSIYWFVLICCFGHAVLSLPDTVIFHLCKLAI